MYPLFHIHANTRVGSIDKTGLRLLLTDRGRCVRVYAYRKLCRTCVEYEYCVFQKTDYHYYSTIAIDSFTTLHFFAGRIIFETGDMTVSLPAHGRLTSLLHCVFLSPFCCLDLAPVNEVVNIGLCVRSAGNLEANRCVERDVDLQHEGECGSL